MRAICALVNVGNSRSICEGALEANGTCGSRAFTVTFQGLSIRAFCVAQRASPSVHEVFPITLRMQQRSTNYCLYRYCLSRSTTQGGRPFAFTGSSPHTRP